MIVGLDTNILCYALDPAYPEHAKVKNLLTNLSPENMVAINPTVLHEAYHTLVHYLEWTPEEAARRLLAMLKHPYIKFYNQTQKTSQIALHLATKHGLDGRDALIIANYVANKTPTLCTHDKPLLKLQKIAWKNTNLTLKDPLNQK
ncbi:MAG: PIN domain-containing protein [Candidatus Bathyarchaeota archaeon]|nr:PIN domain-containing protein [Candidatus Bathyarchaeota archaeon]